MCVCVRIRIIIHSSRRRRRLRRLQLYSSLSLRPVIKLRFASKPGQRGGKGNKQNFVALVVRD